MDRSWMVWVPLTAISIGVGLIQTHWRSGPPLGGGDSQTRVHRPSEAVALSLALAPRQKENKGDLKNRATLALREGLLTPHPSGGPVSPPHRFLKGGPIQAKRLRIRQLERENRSLRQKWEALWSESGRRNHQMADLTDTVSQLQRRVEQLEQREGLPVEPILAAEWEVLGVAYLQMGDAAKAREALYRALALNPEDPALHYNCGVLCDDFLKQPIQALRHYRKFLALAPEDPDAARVREWVRELEAR